MTLRRFAVAIPADADGDAEVYSQFFSGKIVSFRYVKDDFADGVDFVVTSEATGATLWAEENVNASATRLPRAATHSTAGVAAIYAADAPVNTKISLGSDRVKIVVANAGEETSGTLHITVDG